MGSALGLCWGLHPKAPLLAHSPCAHHSLSRFINSGSTTCDTVYSCMLCQDVEYFLIKWKGWANVFNSWEPRSNLGCEELITDFQGVGRKRLWQYDPSAANDPETKKQKISELVDTMLALEPKLTARGLIELYEQLDVSKVEPCFK